ncbi:MAG: PrsW family intramembrane metalloprotease, partial [Bradymonadaceae bacterium]
MDAGNAMETVEMGIILGGVGIATMVVVSYLVFIWWLDRYEREPIWLVLLTFLWGALIGTCLGCVLSIPGMLLSVGLFGAEMGGLISAVVVAPLVEEFTKGLVFVLLLFTRHIDNETDGLIYGAATGLGFATLENLAYFVGAAEGGMEVFLGIVTVRTLFTALVHCISSALLGMFIGYARHRSGQLRWLIYPGIGFGLAVLNHGLWNLLATLSGFDGSNTEGLLFLLLGMAMVVGLSVMMFALTQLSLKREHDVIRRFLLKEAEKGTLPRAHAEIIPYWSRRRKKGWLDPKISQNAYIQAATLLAFRHYQMEIAEGERSEQYLKDIERYRHEVQAQL